MLDERKHEKCFYSRNRVEYIDNKLSNLKVCIMRIPSPEGSESLHEQEILLQQPRYSKGRLKNWYYRQKHTTKHLFIYQMDWLAAMASWRAGDRCICSISLVTDISYL